jgi:TonB family protein
MSYWSRFTNLFRRRSLERDLDDEIGFHFEERIRRGIASGMSPEAAEADARRRFGSVERAKAGMRAARLPSTALLAVVALSLVAGAAYFQMRERVYDLGGNIAAPVPMVRPRPQYTAAALREKIHGSVNLACIVRRDGLCSDVTVVRSLDKTFGLDDEAVRAAREWRFRPGTREGTPVATRVNIEFTFTLR